MIALAAALALFAQDPITAEDFGRTLFLAGMCEGIGFDLDRPVLYDMGRAAADADPDPDAWIARTGAAVDAYEVELGEELAGMIGGNDPAAAGLAWARLTVDRCDALSRAFPGVVLRTAETETRIQAWMTRLDAE